LEKKSNNKSKELKASALLCPNCCTEYVEVEFDIEINGFVIPKVAALKCPACAEEHFTAQQFELIRKRIDDSN